MAHILALDQGTTSSRAIVFDESGAVVAVAQQEFEQRFPRSGWVEHDPREIWSSQSATIAQAMTRAGLRGRDIAAVGITNQRETTLIWDRRTGEPIHHAIVWQDRRTAPMIDRVRADGAELMIREATGLVPDAYFSASKVAWLLDHVEGARERAERGELAMGTVDTWLLWKLTDGALHATDVTNASRTMLLNIRTLDWDDRLLELWNVPRSLLPEVRACDAGFGEVAAEGPIRGVAIGGVAGDQHAAMFGQLCTREGMAKNTYGTGCFMLMNTGDAPVASDNNLLSTVAYRVGDRTDYALEGAVFIAGAVVQWLRDGLKLIRTAGEIERIAETETDNGGVYLVPAFAGLGAPHWDPYARGTMCGLSRGTTGGHLARAALESIAFQVADLMDAMEADTSRPLDQLRVDGGAASNDLLMQIQADLLQRKVVRPAVTETTALGAAYLAGLATGVWKSTDDLAHHWKVDRAFDPAIDGDRAAAMRAQWTRAVERSKAWATDGVDA